MTVCLRFCIYDYSMFRGSEPWSLKKGKNTGLGIRSLVFWANCLFFAKNEQMSYLLKIWAICLFAHFWWATWGIRSHRSFLVINLRDSLTSLIFGEQPEVMSESYQENTILVKFFWANCSLFVSKTANEWFAQKKKRFAHLLIYHERPEWIAHVHSFAHLSWATWAISSR